MTNERVVGEKILEYLDQIDKDGGKSPKWHLEKIAGNVANFSRWVDRYLIQKHGLLTTISEDGKEFYVKTPRGEKAHEFFRTWKPFLPYLAEFGTTRLEQWMPSSEDLFRYVELLYQNPPQIVALTRERPLE